MKKLFYCLLATSFALNFFSILNAEKKKADIQQWIEEVQKVAPESLDDYPQDEQNIFYEDSEDVSLPILKPQPKTTKGSRHTKKTNPQTRDKEPYQDYFSQPYNYDAAQSYNNYQYQPYQTTSYSSPSYQADSGYPTGYSNTAQATSYPPQPKLSAKANQRNTQQSTYAQNLTPQPYYQNYQAQQFQTNNNFSQPTSLPVQTQAAVTPEKKPSFWTKHKKKILTGLGVAATAAAVVAAGAIGHKIGSNKQPTTEAETIIVEKPIVSKHPALDGQPIFISAQMRSNSLDDPSLSPLFFWQFLKMADKDQDPDFFSTPETLNNQLIWQTVKLVMNNKNSFTFWAIPNSNNYLLLGKPNKDKNEYFPIAWELRRNIMTPEEKTEFTFVKDSQGRLKAPNNFNPEQTILENPKKVFAKFKLTQTEISPAKFKLDLEPPVNDSVGTRIYSRGGSALVGESIQELQKIKAPKEESKYKDLLRYSGFFGFTPYTDNETTFAHVGYFDDQNSLQGALLAQDLDLNIYSISDLISLVLWQEITTVDTKNFEEKIIPAIISLINFYYENYLYDYGKNILDTELPKIANYLVNSNGLLKVPQAKMGDISKLTERIDLVLNETTIPISEAALSAAKKIRSAITPTIVPGEANDNSEDFIITQSFDHPIIICCRQALDDEFANEKESDEELLYLKLATKEEVDEIAKANPGKGSELPSINQVIFSKPNSKDSAQIFYITAHPTDKNASLLVTKNNIAGEGTYSYCVCNQGSNRIVPAFNSIKMTKPKNQKTPVFESKDLKAIAGSALRLQIKNISEQEYTFTNNNPIESFSSLRDFSYSWKPISNDANKKFKQKLVGFFGRYVDGAKFCHQQILKNDNTLKPNFKITFLIRPITLDYLFAGLPPSFDKSNYSGGLIQGVFKSSFKFLQRLCDETGLDDYSKNMLIAFTKKMLKLFSGVRTKAFKVEEDEKKLIFEIIDFIHSKNIDSADSDTDLQFALDGIKNALSTN